ncbi:MAG: GNAT family N-acetyltransferase [Pseudomonadota bacterium]
MRPIPEGYSLRRAELADIAVFGGIESAADSRFEGTGLLDGMDDADTIPREVFEAAIPAGLVTVLEHETDGVIGYTLCSYRPPDHYLDQVAVHPDHGRRGLGRALVEAVLLDAEARRLPAVSLSTFIDVPWNAPFYASIGFKPVKRSKLTPWMLELERLQAEQMDVSKRCFMRRKVRRPLLRR